MGTRRGVVCELGNYSADSEFTELLKGRYITDIIDDEILVLDNGMLLWAFDVSAYDAYTDVQDADRFLPEIIIGEALEEWEEIVASIAARGDSREYAWLFPCGLKPALNHAGMMMFASNQS